MDLNSNVTKVNDNITFYENTIKYAFKGVNEGLNGDFDVFNDYDFFEGELLNLSKKMSKPIIICFTNISVVDDCTTIRDGKDHRIYTKYMNFGALSTSSERLAKFINNIDSNIDTSFITNRHKDSNGNDIYDRGNNTSDDNRPYTLEIKIN